MPFWWRNRSCAVAADSNEERKSVKTPFTRLNLHIKKLGEDHRTFSLGWHGGDEVFALSQLLLDVPQPLPYS